MATIKTKIESIKIERIPDDNLDLSYLGEYTSKVPDKADINRNNAFLRVNRGRNEYKYFIPANRVESTRRDLIRMGWNKQDAEVQARKQNRQDFERMEEFAAGDVSCMGIKAIANLLVPLGENYWIHQSVESGGLWGIESDSNEEYIKEVAEEELSELREILGGLTIGKRTIATALKKVEFEDD